MDPFTRTKSRYFKKYSKPVEVWSENNDLILKLLDVFTTVINTNEGRKEPLDFGRSISNTLLNLQIWRAKKICWLFTASVVLVIWISLSYFTYTNKDSVLFVGSLASILPAAILLRFIWPQIGSPDPDLVIILDAWWEFERLEEKSNELKETAEKILVRHAETILRIQDLDKTGLATSDDKKRLGEKNREFKDLHSVLHRLKLVESEWHSFYRKARAKIETKA